MRRRTRVIEPGSRASAVGAVRADGPTPRRGLGARLGTLGCLAALCLASTGSAQEPDPFAAVPDADPMELARLVDRRGDDAVLARLGGDAAFAARLGAVRAAPFMTGPELALDELAALAAGRHPHLAPAAARSAALIARRLDAAQLARREQLPASLADAAEGFDALADDDAARPDLRVVASTVAAQLRAAGVPDTP
jgi:hypothetical protein